MRTHTAPSGGHVQDHHMPQPRSHCSTIPPTLPATQGGSYEAAHGASAVRNLLQFPSAYRPTGACETTHVNSWG